MAYVVPQELRQELPNGGKGVTNAKLEVLISDAVEVVTLANESAPENGLSRRAVREYARSEALKVMRAQGDRIPQTDIDYATGRARDFTDAYRSATASTLDDSADRPRALVGGTPW